MASAELELEMKFGDCENDGENDQEDAAYENLRNDEFMEEVRKYPVVYDKYCCDFKNPNKKERAWKTIADKFNIQTTVEAKKRYYNIRTHYGRYKKRLKTIASEPGRKPVPKAPDIDLSWLDTYIEPRQTNSAKNTAIPSPSSSSTQVKIFHIEKEENSDNEETFEVLEGENRPESGIKRECDKALDNELLLTMKSLRQELRDQPDKEKAISDDKDDEDVLFSRSIVPKLRRISPRLKSLAQIQILQVIAQYEAQSEIRQACAHSLPVLQESLGTKIQTKGTSVTSTTHAHNTVETFPSPTLEETAASANTHPFQGMGIPPVFPN